MTGISSLGNSSASCPDAPQWSPVEMTGIRGGHAHRVHHLRVPAMEPGRDDRDQPTQGALF